MPLTQHNNQHAWRRAKFAKTYNVQELQVLLDLKTENKTTLSWCHVQKLLMLSKPSDRRAFAKKAVRKSWSASELSRAIEGQHGVRKQSGRPTEHRPLNAATMRELEQQTDQLRHLFDAFRSKESGDIEPPSAAERVKCQPLLPNVLSKLRGLRTELNRFATQLANAVGTG